jgi:hypothetical protein
MLFDKSHMEPAHPMVVALHDSLIAIYKLIREKYQAKIDATFDEVSRQVGFVVTTTVPVEIEVANGKIKSATIAEGLKGTLFEKIAGAVGSDAIAGNVAAGKYGIYLIWYPALKLRLRTDFMEPAHLSGGGVFAAARSTAAAQFVPGVREPAHWFDAGSIIAGEEAVLINAIDEVYPELRLAERVSVARQAGRAILGPGIHEPAHLAGIREPAHLGPGVREPAHFTGIREPAHFGPGVREPAHFQQPDVAQQFASELAALMKRFGF